MRLLVVMMIGLWAVSAWADDLPNNLVLKCEGKESIILNLDGRPPEFINNKHETMLRLKDGELSDTSSQWLTIKGCVLRNGIVRCSKKSVEAHPPIVGSGSD